MVAGLAWWVLSMEINAGENGMVFIPRNTSVVAAIDSIDAQCPMPTPWLVKLAARVTMRLSPLTTIHSGWYVFHQGDEQFDVLEALFTGRRRPTVQVTIPEGLTAHETALLLGQKLDTDTASLASAFDSLEGRLFPNTYEFFWREGAEAVAERLVREYERQVADSEPTNDQLILASIVQAEAADEAEMPRIAGVYMNRLKRGMRLESDPTVQYGLGKRERVLYEHLAVGHEWNTYVHVGLPPTPICNPGLRAIRAAQDPEEHAYFFFVARGDGSGKHWFAKTYAEHVRNVARYRAARAGG